MRELILFTLSGLDKPGLTSELTRLVSEAGIGILDIGQATIHDTLSLGLLLDFPPGSVSKPVVKDLLFKAHELGLSARFEPVELEAYEAWVGAQGKPRHIITVLGSRIDAEALHRIAAEVACNGLNIDSIKRLSGRTLRVRSRSGRDSAMGGGSPRAWACWSMKWRTAPRWIASSRNAAPMAASSASPP